MDKKGTIIKYLLYSIGFIIILSLPFIGILAMWDFDTNKLVADLSNFFKSNEGSSYNFEIPAGEDDILTASLKDTSASLNINHDGLQAELLILESAGIEGPIVYGIYGEELLRQGFWHHPATVYPGEKGVSVIFGHRRYHLPPAKDTFYNLDKAEIGDRIEFKLTDGTWLEYTIISINIIDPSNLESVISEKTDRYIVELITCTPLGTDRQRLVISAEKSF